MKRYAIINEAHFASDGVYYCKGMAESAAKKLKSDFGGVWVVVALAKGFKPEGFSHLGEHGVKQRVRREMNEA